MSFNLRTDSITNLNNDGPVNILHGTSLPSNTFINIDGEINVSGISTIGIISASGAVVSGVVTATSFVGDGSGLTAIQSVSPAKSIALAIIGS